MARIPCVWRVVAKRMSPALLLSFAFTLMGVAQQSEPPKLSPAGSIAAKTSAQGSERFEVASIREDVSGKFIEPGFSMDTGDDFKPTGLFEATAPLRTYLAFAYKLNQLSPMFEGLPPWASQKRFAIRARTSGSTTKDQMRQMMQSLLEERFHLVMHFENRTMPVFALQTVTPEKFGNGIRLHADGPACDVMKSDRSFEHPETFLDAVPCNVYTAFVKAVVTIAAARNTTLSQMAAFLSNVGHFGKPVIDETGIGENVDFVVHFSQNLETDAARNDAEFSEEPLRDAVRDQLGLKLVPKTASVRVPVIDHLELPSDN